MPKKKYSLKEGESQRLEVSWKGNFKSFTVRFDENEIGMIANVKELKEGREFTLSDGSVLNFQLVSKFFGSELQVLNDGHPLPGSDSDPAVRLKIAYSMVFFIAGLNILIGLITIFFQIELLSQLGLGIGSIIFGAFFLLFGFFVKRKSMIALGLAVGLFSLDSIFTIILPAIQQQEGYNPPTTGIIVRILFLIPMIRGFGAIRELKKKKADQDEFQETT